MIWQLQEKRKKFFGDIQKRKKKVNFLFFDIEEKGNTG